MKNVLIYLDEGVGPLSFKETMKSVKEEIKAPIKSVDSRFLLEEEWEEQTRLLVFPGGRDVPYHNKLQGKANAKIAQYVASGGSYLGICAGAYFASASIEFEKGNSLEIVEKRALGFFPGKAVGPAYGPNQFCYKSEAGTRVGRVIRKENGEVYSLYYNGGCYFEACERHKAVQVVARYEDIETDSETRPAAIILCSVGKGKALLSGLHPEYRAPHIRSKDPYLQAVLPTLRAHESKRAQLWKELMALV